jgi:hypothetical protein
MQQNYHMNANTNSHSRAIIHRAKEYGRLLFFRSLSDSEGGDKIKGHPTRRQAIWGNVFGKVCPFKADHDFILCTLENKGGLYQNLPINAT